jgi:hypothetical protein
MSQNNACAFGHCQQEVFEDFVFRCEVNVVHLMPLRRLVAFTLQTNGLGSGSWNVAHRVRYTTPSVACPLDRRVLVPF